jgi:hypothetical protein
MSAAYVPWLKIIDGSFHSFIVFAVVVVVCVFCLQNGFGEFCAMRNGVQG